MMLLLALGAAFCNALSSVMQKLSAQAQPDGDNPEGAWAFVSSLVRRPAWLIGMLALTASFLLHASALNRGALATVQLCLVAEMPFLMFILLIGFRQRLGSQEWLGVLGIAVGVASFLLVADPSGGHSRAPLLSWAVTGAAIGAVMVGAVFLGQRSYGSRPAMYFGLAAALGFAVTAALTKDAVTRLTHHGVRALFTSWPTYAMAVLGATALILAGKAFQRGSIAAAQAAFSVVDPLASIAIGIGLFGEHLRSQPIAVVAEVASMAVMIAGVMALSTSSLVYRAERLPAPAWRRGGEGAEAVYG